MSADEEINELVAVYHHMASKLTVILAHSSLGNLGQKECEEIKLAAVELVNGLEDARAATRRLSERLTGPRRGTGELKAD